MLTSRAEQILHAVCARLQGRKQPKNIPGGLSAFASLKVSKGEGPDCKPSRSNVPIGQKDEQQRGFGDRHVLLASFSKTFIPWEGCLREAREGSSLPTCLGNPSRLIQVMVVTLNVAQESIKLLSHIKL